MKIKNGGHQVVLMKQSQRNAPNLTYTKPDLNLINNKELEKKVTEWLAPEKSS